MGVRMDERSTLEGRVRVALGQSHSVVRRSRVVIGARRFLRDDRAMLTRCAWCSSVFLGGEWAAPVERPSFLWGDLSPRTTHSICPTCVAVLERSGASRLA